VAAKRERNRKVLEKSVDEIASVLGGSKKSDNNESSAPSNNKKKRSRRGSNQSATGGSQVVKPLRRNPKRSARSTTSSISSQSHFSSSACQSQSITKRRKRKRKTSSRNIPIPAIPDGQTELRVPCPEIGPGWTMRIRARKFVPTDKPGPTVDRVFISPIGNILRSMSDVDRFMGVENGSIMSDNIDERTIGNNSAVSFGDAASICSTSPSLPTSVNLKQQNPLQKLVVAPTTATTGIMSEAQQKGLPTLASAAATMPDQSSLLPKYIMVKDMSASLEHVLLNGGRVQAREDIWKDFLDSETVLGGDEFQQKTPCHTKKKKGVSKKTTNTVNKEKADESRNKERMIHLSDWKLYHPIIAQSSGRDQLNNTSMDDDKFKNDTGSGFGSFADDDDNIVIPEEYLMTTQSKSEPAATSRHHQEQRHQKMLQETLPLNNPVKYNNIVRERHSYYTSDGPDRHWDQEYGDGIDPEMFVQECCRNGNVTAATGGVDTNNDSGSKDGSERPLCEHESDMSSFMAKKYTSSLLQRCWDRAVHAASSTLTVAPAANQGGLNATLGASLKQEENDVSVLQSQTVADSILQREAMNVVDSILDVLLANGNGNNLRQKLQSTQAGSERVDWRHVLNCLQTAARQEKEIQGGDSGPAIQVNEKRCPIPLNHISLKALSMRLIERYGTETHRMPP